MTARASTAELAAYLSHIGFGGRPRIDLATLAEVHRRHADRIAWESIDCFVGRPVGRDPRTAFDKLVRQGRGGWCYEMNGLLAWMLEAIGFRVTRLATAVMREQLGDDAIGNHLMLLVHLDRDYIADVGIGSGLVEPIPLAEGRYRQRRATFALERLDGRLWRFHNQPGALPPSFDFALDLVDDALLDRGCRWLQTDPASPFLQNVVIQRHGPHGLDSLVNATRSRLADGVVEQWPLDTPEEYARELRTCFGLPADDVPALWARLADGVAQPC